MEIERKFLVDAPPGDLDRHPSSAIEQGYLAIEPGGVEVRVRRRGGTTVLTAKAGTGRTRAEEEVAIDADAFERLWPLTAGRRVEKVRHLIPLDGDLTLELDVYGGDLAGPVVADGEFTLGLDVYGGDLAGLVVAEVEFPDEATADAFAPPAWLGADVTDDERYKNHRLAVDGRPRPTSVRTPPTRRPPRLRRCGRPSAAGPLPARRPAT